MPTFKDAPPAMNKIMEAAYSAALKKYAGNKKKASMIAISAAKNAGYVKGKDGKWTMKKKEMSEEIVIDAFKEGTYPQGIFATKELSEIASTYDPKVYEAPILIGHISDPSYKGKSAIPAFGWIGKVKIAGDHLKLVASQFSDQLKDFIKQGFYKKVSAAFFDPQDPNNPTPGKWHLHHLAFLGGTPPAVKGLEQIAFNERTWTLLTNEGKWIAGVEMAEADAAVTVDGNAIDAVEEVGEEDTLKDLTESCATFISKIEESLGSDVDYETQKSRCSLAAFDLQNEIQSCLDMHWAFQEKLENIEEHQEAEMSEKKTIKQVLVEMAQNLIHKRKETEVDTKKEQEYLATIAEKDAKIKEFSDKEALAVAEKAKADKEASDAALLAKDETLKAEIKTFCDSAIKENRMIPAERNDVKDDKGIVTKKGDESIMFDLAKTSPDALKSFQEKYVVGRVPLGVVDFGKDIEPDGKPQIFKDAEKYVKDHPKEFADINEDAQKVNRAVYLQKMGRIKF